MSSQLDNSVAVSDTGALSLSSRGLAQRTVYAIHEHETVAVTLSELLSGDRLDLYPEVVASGYFDVDLKRDQLLLRAGGFVGFIPLNDRIAIEVRPRVPIGNLTHVFRKSGLPGIPLHRFLRLYQSVTEPDPSISDLMAQALVDGVDDIRNYGLLREYQRQETTTSYPRGRILVGPTLVGQQAKGYLHRAVVSYFDRTIDNGANRCLKYAVWFLAQQFARLRSRTGGRRLQVALNNAYRAFDGVALDYSRDFLSDSVVLNPETLPPLREYYAPTLQVAKAIIGQYSVALDRSGTDLRLATVLINMDTVFEQYLRQVLTDRLTAATMGVLDGNKSGAKLLFDEPPSEPAKPDIVLKVRTDDDWSARVIIDVKYKPASGSPDRQDLNQIIAYGASYRASQVVIVQPCHKPGTGGSSSLGTIGSMAISQYRFDLSAADLEDEERRFADLIHSLAA